MELNDFLTIGDIARATATTPRTIRFYEDMGLIKPLKRTKSGYRLFGQAELQKLRLITALKRSGFQLKSIRSLLMIKNSHTKASQAAKAANDILLRHMPDVDETVMSVKTARDDMHRTIEMLKKCYGCEEALNRLDCSKCEQWEEMMTGDPPMTLGLIWPSIGQI